MTAKISKTALGASALLLASAGAAHSADKVSKSYDLDGFERIEVKGVFELRTSVGGDYAIELSGRQKEMDRLEIAVEDGTLTLGMKKRKGVRFGGDRESIRAQISMPRMTGLDVAGVAEVDVKGIDAAAYEASLSGVGEVTLAGECGRLDAAVSGVGELNAKDLECRDVDVSVSGVGEALVHAAERADASVSGMGSIEIYGQPDEVERSGGFLSSIDVIE